MILVLSFSSITFVFSQGSNTIFWALDMWTNDEYIQMNKKEYWINDSLPVNEEFHNSADLDKKLSAEEILEYADMHKEKLDRIAEEKNVLHNSAWLPDLKLPAYLPETGASL